MADRNCDDAGNVIRHKFEAAVEKAKDYLEKHTGNSKEGVTNVPSDGVKKEATDRPGVGKDNVPASWTDKKAKTLKRAAVV